MVANVVGATAAEESPRRREKARNGGLLSRVGRQARKILFVLIRLKCPDLLEQRPDSR